MTEPKNTMIRPHASTGLMKHGYGIGQVKQWRNRAESGWQAFELGGFLSRAWSLF